MLKTHKIFILLLSKCENRILRGEIPYISRHLPIGAALKKEE